MPASSENKLGLWTSTSLVIGNMIGAGVFLLPATLASFGAISLVGWIVSTIGALLLARIFAKLSRLVPNGDGGPYAYTRKGFGNFAGFIVAWGYWISCWCTNAAITVSLVGALSVFFPVLASSTLLAIGTGLGVIWVLTWVNTRGIKASGNMQLVTTILKLIPLILVSAAGLFFVHAANFKPFNLSGGSDASAIAATSTLTFFAFLGLECATIPSGSVKNPDKTIPRATMLGTLIATVVYILCTVSVMGIIPAKTLQQSVTPFADTAVIMWGNNARYWIGAGVVIAAFGALNGWILITGQVSSAIARDHLFPAIFEKQNKKGVPAAGIVISSVLVSVIMMMNFTSGLVEQFKLLMLLTTLTVLVPYLFSTASYVVLSNRREKLSVKKRVLLLAPSALTFAFCLWAIIGSGEKVLLWGTVMLLSGVPIYFWIVWKKTRIKKNIV
jgi:basic amino acid/polyamine antiporter, APA family